MIRMSGKDIPLSAESEAGALAILRALRDVPEPHRLDALGLAVDVASKTDWLTRWPHDAPSACPDDVPGRMVGDTFALGTGP